MFYDTSFNHCQPPKTGKITNNFTIMLNKLTMCYFNMSRNYLLLKRTLKKFFHQLISNLLTSYLGYSTLTLEPWATMVRELYLDFITINDIIFLVSYLWQIISTIIGITSFNSILLLYSDDR